MPDYFYQIKVRKAEYDPSEFWATPWQWPPVFSGKVTAADRKEARALVDDEFGRKFPMRVAEKDIQNEPYLLNIREINPADTRTLKLFEISECKACGAGFRVIDHYNNDHQNYKGTDYCGDECKERWTLKEKNEKIFSADAAVGSHPPVIYKIENIRTGLSYVGQTTQAFTLRWWQHFFHGTDTKFHRAIKDSKLTDWAFCILEIVDLSEKPENMPPAEFITRREQHWIDALGTVATGYNTATAKVLPAAMPLLEGAAS